MARPAAQRATETVIGRVGLADLAGHRVEELSHGNQQRVQLAIALVHEPELLILDEPFAGLDPLGVAALGELLGALAEDGAAVLFSSHQLDLVQHLCQDIVTVDHGRVVLEGSLEQLQAAAGRRQVTVIFARTPPAYWSAGLPDVDVEAADDRHVRLAVSADRDPGDILRAARAAGPLISFEFEPPSLDEMFRMAVAR
ncbi:MAG TPA: hypothetical protein DHU96_14405 [Actinobacteria bacterium]|nr:hypothetical protein [Actinomycetota bacterium]